MVFLGFVQCLRNVRYLWCHVDGYPFVCLWTKECLDSLAMARMESGFCDDIFGSMDQALQRYDWSLLDSYPF